MNIVPFLKKYGINPATGEKLSAKELVRLNFHKNADGKYHCPVIFKVFNENTHIVAVKPTGNVFAYEVRCFISNSDTYVIKTKLPTTTKRKHRVTVCG